jgi:hypothetical protein
VTKQTAAHSATHTKINASYGQGEQKVNRYTKHQSQIAKSLKNNHMPISNRD